MDGNPASSNPPGDIPPTASAHSVPLSHFGKRPYFKTLLTFVTFDKTMVIILAFFSNKAFFNQGTYTVL